MLTFINFASERWTEEIREKSNADEFEVLVAIEGESRRWFGDWRLYYAANGSAWIHNAVVCACMALEKWLHDRLTRDEQIETVLTEILGASRSVALAGVLISFGKRDPQRLLKMLWPLTQVAEFHCWEDAHNHEILETFPYGFNETQQDRKARAEWAQLPFRRKTLGMVCSELYANESSSREHLAQLAALWRKRLEESPTEDRVRQFLPRLIGQFDPENWRGAADGHQTFESPTRPAQQAVVQVALCPAHWAPGDLRREGSTPRFLADRFSERRLFSSVLRSTEVALQ